MVDFYGIYKCLVRWEIANFERVSSILYRKFVRVLILLGFDEFLMENWVIFVAGRSG